MTAPNSKKHAPILAAQLGLLVLVTGCSETSYADEQYESGFEELAKAEDGEPQAGADSEFDEDAARSDAEQEVADDRYDGPCTSDCSGHDAGFAWAADGHEDYGTSRSPSFDEGQVAYEDAVEERLEEKRQEFEDEGSDSDYAM